MQKIYLSAFCFLLILSTPKTGNSQGKIIPATDETVEKMEANRKTRTPYSILFKENSNQKLTAIQQLFQKHLKLRSGIDELREIGNNISADISVTRYQQYFKGIKVEHGNYIATAKNRDISFINGDFYSIEDNMSITPLLTPDAARKKAWDYIDGEEPDDSAKATGELVFVEDGINTKMDGKVYLAYKFLIDSRSRKFKFEDVYVDANTGKILFTNSQTKTGCFENPKNYKSNTLNIPPFLNQKLLEENKVLSEKSPNSPFVLADADTRYSGNVGNMITRFVNGKYRLESTVAGEFYPTHTKDIKHADAYNANNIQLNAYIAASAEITDANNNWTNAEYNNANFDNTAFDVHWGTQRVYEYWKDRHNRNSWNGTNGVINSYVHTGVNFDNAFWQGAPFNAIFYGDGSNLPGGLMSVTSLDVVSHEIGHGVCQSTANLTLNGESGALNEGFSDIWGAAVEQYFPSDNENDAVAKNSFLIGEEVAVGKTGIRNMKNPNLTGQPDTYLGINWDYGLNTSHTNNGVLSYWFYLLIMGGSGTNDNGNNYAVSSMGWENAEKIAFLGETNLTPSADYAACRTATINAATTLFGACSPQTEAVTRAWYAVGVGADFVPCVPTVQFDKAATTVTETAAPHLTCVTSKTITVGVFLSKAASQKTDVTFTTIGSTAIAGKDFSISPASLTFPAGSTAVQNVTITIYDDGVIDGTKILKLAYTVNANGGDAVKSNTYNTYIVTIKDDDIAAHSGFIKYVDYGNYTTDLVLNNGTLLDGLYANKKVQHLYTAADLLSFGLEPGFITHIAFNVSKLGNVFPYDDFNMKVGFVSPLITSINGSFIAGLTPQNSIPGFTPVLGWNDFALSNALIWDGVQNMVIEFCYSNGAQKSTGGNIMAEYGGIGNNVTAYDRNFFSNGCALSNVTNSQYRPILKIRQTILETPVENIITSRPENLGPMEEVYFYSPKGKIMARVQNLTNFDYGCTLVEINRTGNNAQYMTGDLNNNPKTKIADKTFKITPTNNISSGKFRITLYYTAAEKNGYLAASTRIWQPDNGVNNGTKLIKNPIPINDMVFPNISSAVIGVESIGSLGFGSTITAVFNGFLGSFGVGVPPGIPTKPPHSSFADINYNEAESGLIIAPNPTSNNFTVQYNNIIRRITIMDAAGKIVKEINSKNNSSSVLVDASGFEKGIYLVKILTGNNDVITKKLIKQ